MKNIKVYEEYDGIDEGKVFTDANIAYYERLWNGLHIKYTNNKFFQNVYNQMRDRKKLSDKQWAELEFLLQNGKSRYESGVLPRNY